MQRTPPAASPTLSASRSDSDLTRASETKNDTNITTRNKRQRMDMSPDKSPTLCTFHAGDGDLRNDIMRLLTSWKEDQDRRLSEWKSDLDNTLSKLLTEVSDLKTECREIKIANAEMEKSMDYINKKHEETISKVLIIEKEKNTNTEIIKSLETQIQDLHFQTRQATIEIRNVPLSENENYAKLKEIVFGMGKLIDINIGPEDIRDIYRLPGKPGLPRPIVTEFACVHTRNELISRIRLFNKERSINEKLNTQTIGLPGDKRPVYIDEHLAPSLKKLMFLTRQFAKKHNFSCWHSNGRIFLRTEQTGKPIQIVAEKCLTNLQKKI